MNGMIRNNDYNVEQNENQELYVTVRGLFGTEKQ